MPSPESEAAGHADPGIFEGCLLGFPCLAKPLAKMRGPSPRRKNKAVAEPASSATGEVTTAGRRARREKATLSSRERNKKKKESGERKAGEERDLEKTAMSFLSSALPHARGRR